MRIYFRGALMNELIMWYSRNRWGSSPLFFDKGFQIFLVFIFFSFQFLGHSPISFSFSSVLLVCIGCMSFL